MRGEVEVVGVAGLWRVGCDGNRLEGCGVAR